MKTLNDIIELSKDFSNGHWRKVVSNFEHPASTEYDQVIAAIKEVFPDISVQEAVYRVKNKLEAAPACLCCGAPAAFRTNPVVEYRKYCSTECQHKHSKPAEEGVTIDSVSYESVSVAIKQTGLKRREIIRRIFDSSDSNACWTTDHHQKCIEKLAKAHAILANKFELAKESGSVRVIAEKYGIDRDQVTFAKSFHQV